MKQRLQELYAASPPARLDAQPPEQALSAEAIAAAGAAVDGPAAVALACIYLKNGHLQAAHELAQQVGGRDGDAAHALMHRMEGDYGNTRYWHRRAGEHPSHQSEFLHQPSGGLEGLLADGAYRPEILTDAVETGDASAPDLLQLHNAEIDALFQHCLEQL